MASSPPRDALVAKLWFKDEHDGTASPTSRADLLDNEWTDSGLIAFLLDIVNDFRCVGITAVRRNHATIDGPLGHNPGGKAADGYFMNSMKDFDWMSPASPHFADGLAAARKSAWRFQIGLGGDTRTPQNFAAIGGQVAINDGSAFDDNDSDHIHFGAHAA